MKTIRARAAIRTRVYATLLLAATRASTLHCDTAQCVDPFTWRAIRASDPSTTQADAAHGPQRRAKGQRPRKIKMRALKIALTASMLIFAGCKGDPKTQEYWQKGI